MQIHVDYGEIIYRKRQWQSHLKENYNIIVAGELYQKGDLVFATCPNYKPWPALIIKIQNVDVYQVKFFNHKSTAYIKRYDLIDFNDTTVRRFRKMYKDTRDVQELKILKGIEMAKTDYQKKKRHIQRESSSEKSQLQQQKDIFCLYKNQSSRQKNQSLEIKQTRQIQTDKQGDNKNQYRPTRYIPTLLQTKEILQKIKIKWKPSQKICPTQSKIPIEQKHEFSNTERYREKKKNIYNSEQICLQNKQIMQTNGKIMVNSSSSLNQKMYIRSQQNVKKNVKKRGTISNEDIKQIKSGNDYISIEESNQEFLLESAEMGPRMYIYSQNLKYINFRYDYDDCSLDCSFDQKYSKQSSKLALLKGVLMKKVLLQNKPASFVCNLLRNYLSILQQHLQSKTRILESQCQLSFHQRQILMAIFQCNHISLECLISQKVLKPMINFILTFEKTRGRKKKFFRIEYIIIRSQLNINSHLFQNNHQDYSLFGEDEDQHEDFFLIFKRYDSRTVK